MSKINLGDKFMLDIETLGINNCPKLIQIGCCNFDLNKKIDLRLNTDLQNLSTVDQSTLNFWSGKQRPSGKLSLKEAIGSLRDFLMNADEVWSHDFDWSIIKRICETYGFEIPYHYKRFRCIRTLTALSGIDLKDYNWDKKTHNALDDCIFQVEYCKDAFKKLAIKL